MKRILKLVAVISIIAAMSISVSGCGGSDTGGASAAGESGNVAKVETIKVGMLGLDIKTACIILAKQLGYYEEEGVNVEFETISNLADGLAAVEQGKLDILPFGVIPTCSFVSQGSDVYVIAGTIAEGSEIIVKPENTDSIKTAEDFAGKKIGCFRMETGHMVMKGYLREAGFDINKDVEFIYLDSQNSIMEAVKKGEVDLGFANSGFGYIAKKAGLAVAARVGDFVSDFPCCRQTTSGSAIKNKREALVKFETAVLRGYETYVKDSETAIKTLMEYSGQDEEYVRAIMYGLEEEYKNAMVISIDPSKNKVADFYEVMKANGDIAADTEYSMEEHVDPTIYEEALKLLAERNTGDSFYAELMESFKADNKV